PQKLSAGRPLRARLACSLAHKWLTIGSGSGESMKRTERRHLKENELQTFARDARDRFESKRRETMAVVVIVAVVGVAAVGYFGWRERVQTKAAALLADAVAVKDARIGPPGIQEQGLRFVSERE